MLSNVDIVIVVLYFLILVVIGYLSSKGESEEDFLIGGRSISSLQTITSIGSSLIGAGMLISSVALVYVYGAGAIWLFLGYSLGFLVFYRFSKLLKPLADQYKFYTLPDFFYFRFGKLAGKLSALVLIFTALGWIAVNFIGGGKTIEQFTQIPFHWSTIIAASVIVVYLTFGGFRAVVQTDVVQFFGLFILFILLLFLIARYSLELSAQDFNIFNLPVLTIISFFLVGILVPLSSGELWQRIYAVESLESFKLSTFYLGVLLVVFGFILVLIGLILRNQLPNIDSNLAIVEGFRTLLPSGWRGLAIVVFYSTIMSSADSYLFSASTSFTRDILYRKKESKGNKQLRWFIVLFASLGVSIAIGLKDVLDLSYVLVSMMFALGFIILYVWIFYKKANALSVNTAFVCSIVLLLILMSQYGIGEYLVAGSFIGVTIGIVAVFLYGWIVKPKR